MSAYLYYRRGSPVLHDAYYDRLVKEVASSWKFLDAFKQWQFDSPTELLITGHHIKVTLFVESAAIDWHVRSLGVLPHGYGISDREWRPDIRCRWTPAEPIGVTVKKKRQKKAPRTKPQQYDLFR